MTEPSYYKGQRPKITPGPAAYFCLAITRLLPITEKHRVKLRDFIA